MKNIGIILYSLITLTSCVTYVDNENSYNDFFELTITNDYNIYKNINKTKLAADNQIFYRNNFEIKLPKNIVYWQSGTYDIFEYDSKQIIFIDPGNINKGISQEWKLNNADHDDVSNYLNDYLVKRGYADDNLKKNNNRVTKIYSNGCTTVILYNIKENHFEYFLNLIQTFNYIKN